MLLLDVSCYFGILLWNADFCNEKKKLVMTPPESIINRSGQTRPTQKMSKKESGKNLEQVVPNERKFSGNW